MGKGVGCVYCSPTGALGRCGLALDCVDPPLCDGHVVIAQALSRMRRVFGWSLDEITPQTVEMYLLFNWVPGFDLGEVEGLCASMPEFGVA